MNNESNENNNMSQLNNQPMNIPNPNINPQPMGTSEQNMNPQPMEMPNQNINPQPMGMPNQNINPQPMDMPNQNMNPQPMEMPNQNINPQPMGMPNQNINPQPMGMPNQNMNPQPSKKKINPLFIIIPIVIVVAIIAIILLSSDSGYKTTINNYCNGMNNLDIDAISSAFPKEYSEEVENMKESLDYLEEYKEYGLNFEIACEIGDATEVSSEDLDDLNEEFQSLYDTDRKITKAYTVKVTQTTKMSYEDEEEESSDETEMTLGKIDGTWYIIDD